MKPRVFIIMGVAGSGKTTVGRRLAERWGASFFDGDDFHPAANIQKMSRGIPLTDEDRRPWLERVRGVIDDVTKRKESAVVACSALKESYRKKLKAHSNVGFIYLKGDYDLFLERLKARKGHFVPLTLLESQFRDLEEPADAVILDARLPVDALVEEVLKRLKK